MDAIHPVIVCSESDRAAAVAEQERAEADALTGVLHRRAGLAALQRELDRAYRTDAALTAVVIDVAGHDTVDDQGHRADDTMPLDVACALLSSVRSYDLVIRASGDGFVCALCGVTIADARTRFGVVQQTLAHSGITIAIGCAEVAADDSPTTLIARADADLIAAGGAPQP